MADWDESDDEVAPAPSVPAPVVAKRSKWEGEDEEASGSDDWDASEDETLAKPTSAAAPPKKKMSLKQKLAEKERLAALGVGKEDDGDNLIDYITPQERKRLARQAELDADAEAAADLIGGVNLADEENAPPALASILSAQPRTKPDLDVLSKEIMSAIISRHQSNPLYAAFVETLAKDLCETLASKDVRKVASGLTVLGNTKQTEERDKASGKKKTASKPKLGAAKALAVGKADTTLYDDALDDDDFM